MISQVNFTSGFENFWFSALQNALNNPAAPMNASQTRQNKDNIVSMTNRISFVTNIIPFTGINNENWTGDTLKGYPEQLKYLKHILINPINGNASAAPIVIVYSPDEDVSKLVKECVKKATSASSVQIDMGNDNHIPFSTLLNTVLSQGKLDYYLKSYKKTILMIDNIEKYINSSQYDIDRLKNDFGDVFNEKDFRLIRKYGNKTENITLLKSAADYCSELPKKNENTNAATTIFSISAKPQIIDTELLRRPGKVYTIVFPPASGETVANILQKEVIKQENFLNNIRFMTNQEVEKIDMPYKSWKNLQELKSTGRDCLLNLKSETIPYNVIAEFVSPDNKYGAFKIKQYPEIVKQALYKYIENPEQEFLHYLLKELKTTERMFTPKTLERENKIKNFIEFKKVLDYTKNIKETDKMLKDYKAGFLPRKSMDKLISEAVNFEINSIKGSSVIENPFSTLKNKEVLDKLKTEYILKRIDKLSENRYKFSYQDGKDDYVDLYLGSFGWKKQILWVNSSDLNKIKITEHFIKEIKNINEFKDIKEIAFPSEGFIKGKKFQPTNRIMSFYSRYNWFIKGEKFWPTDRVTINKQPIYKIDLEGTDEN